MLYLLIGIEHFKLQSGFIDTLFIYIYIYIYIYAYILKDLIEVAIESWRERPK